MRRISACIIIAVTAFLLMCGTLSCTKDDRSGVLGIVVPVGKDLVTKDAPYVVTGVYEGSTAYRAGIRPGDRIVQINGVEIKGLRYDFIYHNLLRGPAGTKVMIIVERKGDLRVFNMIRGR